MTNTQIRNTAKGAFIKRTESAQTVYIRGDYVRELKAFSCIAFDDHCKEIFIKADKQVFVDFTY